MKATTDHVTRAVQALIESVTGLVQTLQGALASAPARTTGSAPTRTTGSNASGGRSDSAKAKMRSAQKSYWASLSPAARKKRVEAILRGRGLLPKKGRAAKAKPARKAARAKGRKAQKPVAAAAAAQASSPA